MPFSDHRHKDKVSNKIKNRTLLSYKFSTKIVRHDILNDNTFVYSTIYLFQKNQKKLCGIKKI